MIKNIIFDFDGVICESVHIKTDAFYEMYLPYGEEIAQKVKEYHIANGGMSRYEKFKYFEKAFLGKTLSESKMKELSSQFSDIVKHKVINAPFVEGVLQFLEEHSHEYRCFIISATPNEEMKEIAKEKKIDQYFIEICGSPKNKIEWGKYILDTYKLKPNETIFVGDAISDYNAAITHGLFFILRRTPENLSLLIETPVKSIENFNTFDTLLKETLFI